jgi:uncharacterized protein
MKLALIPEHRVAFLGLLVAAGCAGCAALLFFLLAADAAGADTKPQTIVWKPVSENGVVGTYVRPPGDATVPALVVLGGSDGGVPVWFARMFAEAGWGALALAYFGAEGLPAELANVPLEYFDAAADWLARQPNVDASNLSLIGASRGGELALLIAARSRVFQRVIAVVPSSVVWGPVAKAPGRNVAAWTIAGRPLPFLQFPSRPPPTGEAYRGTPDFRAALEDAVAVEAARIPVEHIRAAVLLLSGEDDQIWPSAFMARMLMQRLEAARHPLRFEHVSYPDAGHAFLRGFDPRVTEIRHPAGILLALGGTESGNRAAQEDSWNRMLAFLRANPRPARMDAEGDSVVR